MPFNRRLVAWAVFLAALLAPCGSAQASETVVLHCVPGGRCQRSLSPDSPSAAAPRTDAISINRVENGTFDVGAGLRAWSPVALYGGGVGSVAWNSADQAGDAGSGSASITNSGSNPDPDPQASTIFGTGQCVRPGNILSSDGSNCYNHTGQVNIPGGQVPGQSPFDATAWFGVAFYASTDCTGQVLGGGAVGRVVSPAGTGGWVTVTPTAPTGCNVTPDARSVLYYLAIEKQNLVANAVTALFDNSEGEGLYGFVKGDLNADGESDLILHNNVTGANQAWFLKDERRTGLATITPAPATLAWQTAGVDDFNGNGQSDLLQWNSATGAAEFWLLNGTARVGAPTALAGALGLPWGPVATGDFDRNGRPDILWRNASTQQLRVWTMNGTAKLGELTPTPSQAVDANWQAVGAVDINKDGLLDLLWYNPVSGRIVYWLLDANLVRTTGNFTTPASAGDANWKVLATADYGIGPGGRPDTTDLVWRNATSGRLVAWFMDAAGQRTGGVFVNPDPAAPATDWTVAGPR